MFEVRARPRGLDDTLDLSLAHIPVLIVEIDKINAEVLCDIGKRIETVPVIDEADADTNAAKATCAADTVQVGVGVAFSLAGAFHGDVVVDDHRHR